MIRLKQNHYSLLGGLVGAATVASVPLTMVQMVQGSKQAQEQEEQAEKQQQVMKEQNDLMRKQNQKLDEIRKASPNVAAVAAQAIQKSYAVPGAVSNILKAGKGAFGSATVGNVLGGVATGAATYGVGKLIQKNQEKKEGKGSGIGTGTKLLGGAAATGLALLGAKKGIIPGANSARLAVSRATAKAGKAIGSNTLMRSGYKDYNKALSKSMISQANKAAPGKKLSEAALTKMKGEAAQNSLKDLGLKGTDLRKSKGLAGRTTELLSKHKGGIIFGAGFGAVPLGIQYATERNQQNEQVEKTYSAPVGAMSKFGSWWKKTKYMPGKKASGLAADFASFGILGQKSTQRFGDSLIKLGQGKGGGTVNNTTVKIGTWIKNNPKYTNMAAIVPGVGIASATFDAPEKLVSKIGNKVDPGAYKYQNQQNQNLQG